MREAGGTRATRYDGLDAGALAARVGVPALHLFDAVASTMDVAHALADGGAPAGTTVLADRQTAGRGRQGRGWESAPGQGVWATLVERPEEAGGMDVLSLRVGLALAEALEPLASTALRLKWPNDVFTAEGKLAGVLIEGRWRDARLDWVAIGIGVNVRPAALPGTGALRPGTSRVEALERIVPAVRRAAAVAAPLSAEEVARFHARDLAVGRAVVAPSSGIVAGIDASGALTILGAAGAQQHRTGSLVFAEDA